ncbi:c-type cytochrome [Adhaeribacter swui]|uniref:C-type cytochrome n=1 Tax=Adhaeribacter swui TaxID=2086471 RepID=A0A7G7GDI4_9BACT|nr:HEAT repeat domain-containing protein [Adhaeribacter swui]QNF35218.1 c-type cytochrome [Adhaeribacter swui]
MRNKYRCFSAALFFLFFTCKGPESVTTNNSFTRTVIDKDPPALPLTPEESMKKVQLLPGYSLELVASEPMVQEPVAIAWDGNGRLFVAEMNTYMLDVYGTDKYKPVSRVKLLEDTNHDGKMDKATVFIDNLVLPRMILPLDDRLLVNETNTNHLWSYRDTDNDGIADEKKRVYENNLVDTRNLEHQKSGLIWNLDNYLYVSRDPIRFRYKNGLIEADSLVEDPGGQWGVAHDNYGRLFFSAGGAERPAVSFQQNPAYGRLDFKDQYNEAFLATYPIIGTLDAQGGRKRMRPEDNTLNHFTSSGGQTIFRGDRLPAGLQGDFFTPEPVGRLIRRAKVINQQGKLTLQNAYEQKEFLASSDMNFRPVNMATGPDGCLYVVDMYHGIIQESEWTKEGSYIRPQILARGLDKNKGRGRIYRIVHEAYKPDTTKPNLLNEPAEKLVSYLNHPNGWWRDNAQKLLIIRNEQTVVPALKALVTEKASWLGKLFAKDKNNHLGKIHALWTLEGLEAIDQKTLLAAFKDEHPQVRKTAVWISEKFVKQNNAEIIAQLSQLMNDPDAEVKIQLALTLRQLKNEQGRKMVQNLIAQNPNVPMLAESEKSRLKTEETLARRKEENRKLSPTNRALLTKGAVIFQQVCAACHGQDGKGIALGSNDMVAPPLSRSKRVNGEKANLIRILLHGLSGPVEGKTYPDVMPAMGHNDDEWIAAVLSYVRNDMYNKAPLIQPEEVKVIRSQTVSRQKYWTLDDLEASAK